MSNYLGFLPLPSYTCDSLLRRALYIFCIRLGCFRATHSSSACSCTMLDLFSFYSTHRILTVRFYGMSKLFLEKKSDDFLKNAKSDLNIGFFSFKISVFFCPISMTNGMKVYLVNLYAVYDFFSSEICWPPRSRKCNISVPPISEYLHFV